MNKPVRIVLAGLGLVGKQHLKALRACPDLELAAIADPAQAAGVIAQAEGVPFYTGLDAVFADFVPDGVVLATPNTLHVDMGLQCIEKGCPVLIEKPVATGADAARGLVLAAAAKGVPVLVGHHRRYSPLIQKAKAICDQGQIGDLRAVHATCWLYKPDAYFDGAPWRKRKGAGPVSVNSTHDVDLLRYLCGEIVRVHSVAAQAVRGYENEDLASSVLTFENGAIGTLTVSDTIVAPWSWELTAGENPAYPKTDQSCYMLGGTHGSLSVPDLRVWRNQGLRGWWEPMSATVQPYGSSDPLVNQLTHFAQVIRGQEQPLVSGAEGTQTLRVVEAIQRSAETGLTVEIERGDL